MQCAHSQKNCPPLRKSFHNLRPHPVPGHGGQLSFYADFGVASEAGCHQIATSTNASALIGNGFLLALCFTESAYCIILVVCIVALGLAVPLANAYPGLRQIVGRHLCCLILRAREVRLEIILQRLVGTSVALALLASEISDSLNVGVW